VLQSRPAQTDSAWLVFRQSVGRDCATAERSFLSDHTVPPAPPGLHAQPMQHRLHVHRLEPPYPLVVMTEGRSQSPFRLLLPSCSAAPAMPSHRNAAGMPRSPGLPMAFSALPSRCQGRITSASIRHPPYGPGATSLRITPSP
jgi:hypothetical protein